MKDIDNELQQKIFEDEIYQFQRVFQPSPQDIPIIDLYDNFASGKIDHEPEYQRKFVWTPAKQSYFIESLIFGIDTPIIYFVEVEKEVNGYKRIVREAIDGRQRLSTIFKFYDNQLKIQDLKKSSPLFEQLNGNTYKELGEKLQNVFKQYNVRTVTFKLVDRNTDIDTQLKFKYQLFHRYNSGLTALNQQEVRNCQYSQDDFHQMFREISKSEIFLKVCPFFIEEQRMADDEFVTLLYLLTLFDDSLDNYAKKSKNPFINTNFERIQSSIYNLETNGDEIVLSEEDEEKSDDVEINSEELSKSFIKKTKGSILDNLEKVYLVYGDYFKGNRQERYLIETLYYHLSKDKRISKQFLTNSSKSLGKYINTALLEVAQKPYPENKDFNLLDCYKEKVAHTARVRYRFSEMEKIINSFFNQLN
ncbi:DUF262 domain-containing protein [Marinifilum fragile]|uniref:DUF262 domain-containing protein n=1 Tax=Marinifilum fragile TaxID=570161 RepID=UPI0006D12C86|nr:DUF262 domain-containing protein [Marinifilum fragile]